MLRSEPQNPTVRTRTSTWPASSVGSASVPSPALPGESITTARITTSSCDEPAPGDLEGVHVVARPPLGQLDREAGGGARLFEWSGCAEQLDALYLARSVR